MKDIVVTDELRAVRLELISAEQQEAEARAELRPLIEEKVEAELSGKKFEPKKDRRIALLRSKLDELTEIAEAKRARVRQLHLLSVGKEVEAAREKQHTFVSEAIRESEKIGPLLRELHAIRRRIAEVEDGESLFIRSLNHQLGLEGRDRLQERLRNNCGSIVSPLQIDVAVWEEFAERSRKGLADF